MNWIRGLLGKDMLHSIRGDRTPLRSLMDCLEHPNLENVVAQRTIHRGAKPRRVSKQNCEMLGRQQCGAVLAQSFRTNADDGRNMQVHNRQQHAIKFEQSKLVCIFWAPIELCPYKDDQMLANATAQVDIYRKAGHTFERTRFEKSSRKSE